MELPEIPILLLYQKNYWPNKLSSMLRGITNDVTGKLRLCEYESAQDLKKMIKEFLEGI